MNLLLLQQRVGLPFADLKSNESKQLDVLNNLELANKKKEEESIVSVDLSSDFEHEKDKHEEKVDYYLQSDNIMKSLLASLELEKDFLSTTIDVIKENKQSNNSTYKNFHYNNTSTQIWA